VQNIESPWCLDLDVELTGVRRARHLAAAFARHEHVDALSESLVLVTSELVSNAIRHADSMVTITFTRHGPSVRVEVTDDGAGLPELHYPKASASSGRGLLIIDGLASDWGSRRSADGKVVWAELAATG
jgi:anti-sigma regulatory factor (Ser/Thr protein kinase)